MDRIAADRQESGEREWRRHAAKGCRPEPGALLRNDPAHGSNTLPGELQFKLLDGVHTCNYL